MIIPQIKTYLPFLIGHLMFTMFLLGLVWYFLARWIPAVPWRWHYPLIIGALISLFLMGDRFIHQLQARHIVEQKMAALTSAAAPTSVEASSPAALSPAQLQQMKADFLRTIDVMAGQASPVTSETKTQLFAQFAPLFPQGVNDRMAYARSILRVYECQKFLFEDALASHKTKKPIKSQERARCEEEGGEFFNREKLIPAEMITGNAKLIESLTATKTGKAEGVPPVPAEALREALESHVRRIDVVRRLFE